MSTYKQMPLPPLGRTATTITEADRAGIMAQAAAVLDYYLNGAGSYYDEGPEKDLDATLGDVHRFYEDIQSLQQSTTDQTGILKDLLKSVDETELRIRTAIDKNDPRDSIQIPLDNAPSSNDIIIDELDENGRLPLGKYIPIALRTNDGISSAYNPQAFWDNQRAASTYQPALGVPSLEDFRAFQALTESRPATFNERWSFSNPAGSTSGIGHNNGIGDWWRNIGGDPKKVRLTANEPSQPLNAAARQSDGAQRVATGTGLFQGPNGQPVTDATGWQSGMFDSALGPVQQAPRLRLVPSQQQSDFDSSAFTRSPVDRAAASDTIPVPPQDISDLLKLRSIIQAVGSRGLFPIQ